MPRLLIAYATTEGHTRKIATRAADAAERAGALVDMVDLTDGDVDPRGYDGAILAGSVHIGRHQTALTHFLRHRLAHLVAMPTALISVSLSAAGDAEDLGHARECVDRLIAETGWTPGAVHLAAGAFRFTQYDWFRGFAMSMIARRKGVAVDRHQDLELTDWEALSAFVRGFVRTLQATAEGT